jgi:hypothetical protein
MNFVMDPQVKVVPELEGRTDLKMVLWAGDCVHDEITDIERLPDFDVYLCSGFIQTLQANVDYMYNNRAKSGVICIIDVSNEGLMDNFVNIFRGKFSVIDSDYNGNTPTLPRKYYDALLSNEGKAFNIKGINGCTFPVEDFQNSMELFAPILSYQDNYLRTWTQEIVDIARVDRLSPSGVWSCPEFKGNYYDGLKARQEQLVKWNKDRNPLSMQLDKYSKDNIEEYWKLLPIHILTVNFERTNSYNENFRNYATLSNERFKLFIIEHTVSMIKTPDEFRVYAKDMSIKKIQDCYRLCKEYPGIEFGPMKDNRTGKDVYGHWISRSR